ncbi:MAG TPA: hypothetical protein VFW87_14275, partial [Pirellulales bacterium]|nr:hypothetical protein [Pirellulales bacterium]
LEAICVEQRGRYYGSSACPSFALTLPAGQPACRAALLAHSSPLPSPEWRFVLTMLPVEGQNAATE